MNPHAFESTQGSAGNVHRVGGVIGALYGLFFGVLGKLFKKIKSKKEEKKVIEKKLVTSAVENDEKPKAY